MIGRAPFVAAIGLSAFTLFSLELLAGDVVLPVFGGAPAVWATTLCFFTGVLFIGYLYAHLLISRLSTTRGMVVHLVVAAVAVGATLLAPAHAGDLRIPGLAEAPNVLIVLAAVAGPPAFLFSATTPLVSAWYARSRATTGSDMRADAVEDTSRDPWWLYAASNGASLVAVLGYPFLVQTFLGLSVQRSLVAVAALVFACLLVLVVVRTRRAPSAGPAAVPDTAPATEPAPTWARQARWLAAAFVPAGLLSAVTTYITTDLVSAPLLWIWPLAIYLASFVIAFSCAGRRFLPRIEIVVPAAATLLWVPALVFGSWPILPLLLVELTSFGVVAIAVHGRLAADRPAGVHLTRFYLVLSAGGVLATGLVAIAAPLVFSGVFEFPMLTIAAIGVMALFPGHEPARLWPAGRAIRSVTNAIARRIAAYAVIGLVFVLLVRSQADQLGPVLVLLAGGAAVIAIARSWRSLAVLSGVAIVVLSFALSGHPLFQERTFFGVLQVRLADDGTSHAEYSGTTLHGTQFLDSRRDIPTSYYVRTGPLGDVFDDLAQRTAGASIGVVGLGTGTIATYERPTDSMTFFEIDPAVERLAEDPQWFTYLADAPVKPRVIIGDARLSLQAIPAASFDVLILDAFSSDNVPAHLLTREAIETYRRVMRPGGIIAFHVSNRSYDLSPGIVSTAESMGLAGRQLAYAPGPARTVAEGADASDWVVVGDFNDLTRFSERGWGIPRPGPVLTDDFSDLLRMLRALQF